MYAHHAMVVVCMCCALLLLTSTTSRSTPTLLCLLATFSAHPRAPLQLKAWPAWQRHCPHRWPLQGLLTAAAAAAAAGPPAAPGPPPPALGQRPAPGHLPLPPPVPAHTPAAVGQATHPCVQLPTLTRRACTWCSLHKQASSTRPCSRGSLGHAPPRPASHPPANAPAAAAEAHAKVCSFRHPFLARLPAGRTVLQQPRPHAATGRRTCCCAAAAACCCACRASCSWAWCSRSCCAATACCCAALSRAPASATLCARSAWGGARGQAVSAAALPPL